MYLRADFSFAVTTDASADMTQLIAKTLAKTLAYIGYHAPGEFGLYWDEDGTMPWKEFYWALQQENDLRFVRDATLLELQHLGCSLPFVLDNRVLRLREDIIRPRYPLTSPPQRLFYGCSRSNLEQVRHYGLVASRRKYLPLASQRILAEAVARRRDPEPILIEILAAKAHQDRIPFRGNGEHHYLIESMPEQYLILPLLAQRNLVQPGKDRKKEKDKSGKTPGPLASAGSFLVAPGQIQSAGGMEAVASKGGGKAGKEGGWKRDARKLRQKRRML